MQSAPGAAQERSGDGAPGAEGRPPRGRVSAGAAGASARRGAATCAGRGGAIRVPLRPPPPHARLRTSGSPRRRVRYQPASPRPAPRALRVAAALTLRAPRPGRGAAFPAARCPRSWASLPAGKASPVTGPGTSHPSGAHTGGGGRSRPLRLRAFPEGAASGPGRRSLLPPQVGPGPDPPSVRLPPRSTALALVLLL